MNPATRPSSANEAGQRAELGRLREGFLDPPRSARPWAFWFWLNGHLSREGITADLEAMADAGIGGVVIVSIGVGDPGPVRFLSDEWRTLFRHVLAEAHRLGLQVDMNNGDGWNCGGPWITPDLAMQKLVWTELDVRGPASLCTRLMEPENNLGSYRDLALLALPNRTPSSPTPIRTTRIAGPQPAILLEFGEVTTARAVTLRVEPAGSAEGRPVAATLSASDDGREFRLVRRFETGWRSPMARYASITVAFPPAEGNTFRLVLDPADGQNVALDGLSISLHSAPRVSYWELKAGHANIREHGGGSHFMTPDTFPDTEESAVTALAQVIDLGSNLGSDGVLRWTVPPGDWTVLRLGHTPTGQKNGPATAEGSGLDCDKLSRAGVQAHFQGMIAKLLEDAGPYVGTTLTYFHNDSWESGCQNWTASFRESFQKLRGYDPLLFLPVMAGGRVIDSRERSERFLWDVRRTIADLIRDEYWGALAALCHQHGVKLSVEAAGRQQFMYDPVDFLAQGDLPIGEFWVGEERSRPDCKLAASVAHAAGTQIAGAEAFTSNYFCGNPVAGWWQDTPYTLKPLGDEAFCAGINRLIFHRFLHQPDPDARPGLAWPGVGTNIDHTQTWWKPAARQWMTYLARCQYLLQQGTFIADACLLTGEGAPTIATASSTREPQHAEGEDASTFTEQALTRSGLATTIPAGYDYDICSPTALAHMKVVDGRVTLSAGTSYAALVLPPEGRLSPAFLEQIDSLVQAGATVIGQKATVGPSLSDPEQADQQVQNWALRLWGEAQGPAGGKRQRGNARVETRPLADVFEELGLGPDFAVANTGTDSHVRFLHRRCHEGTDIYFVANQKERTEKLDGTFRVWGKQPQLWDPDTGTITHVDRYRETAVGTTVPLEMDPFGSIFVVFVEPAVTAPTESAGHSSRPSIDRTRVVHVAGPWNLHFPPGWGAPAHIELDRLTSWTELRDQSVRYFSGTARYTTYIELPSSFPSDLTWWLDLGVVKEVATVTVNGRPSATLWKPPFRADVTESLKPGQNRLDVDITNLWTNRLIGDSALPVHDQLTSTNWNPHRPGDSLLPSGLLGPVELSARPSRTVRPAL